MPPLYSVIIPAYNEEDWLAKTLPATKQAMAKIDASGELIVVDNNSEDKTAEIAKAHGARVVFEPVNQISRARNTGAAETKGDYLFFLDADTLITAELLQQALSALEQKACGGGALVAMDSYCFFWYRRPEIKK